MATQTILNLSRRDFLLQASAASAVRKYPYDVHDRFNSEEKGMFYRHPDTLR